MEWKHILDEVPEKNNVIICVYKPIEEFYLKGDFPEHFHIGMRLYNEKVTIEDMIKFSEEQAHPFFNFFWMYAKDFPFPKGFK